MAIGEPLDPLVAQIALLMGAMHQKVPVGATTFGSVLEHTNETQRAANLADPLEPVLNILIPPVGIGDLRIREGHHPRSRRSFDLPLHAVPPVDPLLLDAVAALATCNGEVT